MRRVLGILAVVVGTGACQDVGHYGGTWQGQPVADPDLLSGFAADANATLSLQSVDQLAITATLTVPPLFPQTQITSILRASGDAIGEVQIGEGALKTYLGFATPTDGQPALTAVSLLPDDRVQLRVIRGADDLYGVFALHR